MTKLIDMAKAAWTWIIKALGGGGPPPPEKK
jgi:hypothetical protein